MSVLYLQENMSEKYASGIAQLKSRNVVFSLRRNVQLTSRNVRLL